MPTPRDGVWEPVVRLGQRVEPGDLLGRLHDFSDHSAPGLEIRTDRAGWVLMLHFRAMIKKGVTLYVVGRETTA